MSKSAAAITVVIMGQKLTVEPLLYRSNKRIAIQLYCENGEPFAIISSNFEKADLAADELCVTTWNLPNQIVDELYTSGLFEDTGKTCASGFVLAPVWRVVCPQILAKIEEQRLKAEEEEQ